MNVKMKNNREHSGRYQSHVQLLGRADSRHLMLTFVSYLEHHVPGQVLEDLHEDLQVVL